MRREHSYIQERCLRYIQDIYMIYKIFKSYIQERGIASLPQIGSAAVTASYFGLLMRQLVIKVQLKDALMK